MGAKDDTVRWPDDSTCIEISKPKELGFWTKWLRVSSGMLQQASRIAGCKFKDVTDFLYKKRVA